MNIMNLCLHKQEQEEVVSNRNYDELKETARKIRVDVIRAIHEAGPQRTFLRRFISIP